MLKDPKRFRKGCLLAVVWLFWFFGGVLYASADGPIDAFLYNMPTNIQTYFGAWLLVSTTLLFFAIVLLIRGWFGGPTYRRSS